MALSIPILNLKLKMHSGLIGLLDDNLNRSVIFAAWKAGQSYIYDD